MDSYLVLRLPYSSQSCTPVAGRLALQKACATTGMPLMHPIRYIALTRQNPLGPFSRRSRTCNLVPCFTARRGQVYRSQRPAFWHGVKDLWPTQVQTRGRLPSPLFLNPAMYIVHLCDLWRSGLTVPSSFLSSATSRSPPPPHALLRHLTLFSATSRCLPQVLLDLSSARSYPPSGALSLSHLRGEPMAPAKCTNVPLLGTCYALVSTNMFGDMLTAGH